MADFLGACHGALRELHIAHNELATDGAAEIILAAAKARDLKGDYSYPRQGNNGHGPAPLWLRLEQNFIDHVALEGMVEAAFNNLHRPGVAMCQVATKACTPHCCVKHRHDTPIIHAKHLANQRSKPPVVSLAGNSTAPAQDILALLLNGKARGSVEPAGRRKSGQSSNGKVATNGAASHRSTGLPVNGMASTSSPADVGRGEGHALGDLAAASRSTWANVMRWDTGLNKWVEDVIEIPGVQQHGAVEDTGRVKLSEELGLKMGNELKSILQSSRAGAGRARKEVSASSAEGMPASLRSAAAGFEQVVNTMPREKPLGIVEKLAMASTDELPQPTTRSSRRGSQQALGADLKHAKGSSLNPQASEFVPAAATPSQNSALEVPLENGSCGCAAPVVLDATLSHNTVAVAEATLLLAPEDTEHRELVVADADADAEAEAARSRRSSVTTPTSAPLPVSSLGQALRCALTVVSAVAAFLSAMGMARGRRR